MKVKAQKSSKPKDPSSPEAEETEVVEEATEETGSEVVEESAEEVVADEKPAKKAPKVTPVVLEVPEVAVAPTKKKGYVNIVALKDIVPAPTVGHYNMGYELDIKGLKNGGRYHVPAHVAEVLVDSNAAVIT